eukprot:3981737-Heterocapsa_arctica.AAC.1
MPRARRAKLMAAFDEECGVAASSRSPSSRCLPGRQRSSSPGQQAQTIGRQPRQPTHGRECDQLTAASP